MKLTAFYKITGLTLVASGVFYGIAPKDFTEMATDIFGQQFTHYTVAFAIAAWIHSGQVKKEIASLSDKVVASIDSVTSALKQDLAVQAKRIGSIETGLINLSTRVDNLETKKTKES